MDNRRKGGTEDGNDREEDSHGGGRAASDGRSPVWHDGDCARRSGVRMRVRLRGAHRDARQGRRAHARHAYGGRGSAEGGDDPSHGRDAGDDFETSRARGEDGGPEVEGRRGFPRSIPGTCEAAHRSPGFAPEAHGRYDGREVTTEPEELGGRPSPHEHRATGAPPPFRLIASGT